MSRYQIESDQYEVWCGWDNPMSTLFGQVFSKPSEEDDDDEDDHIVRWVGGSHDEIKTVEELQRLLAPFVTIPENVVSLLRIDIINATPRTELQELAREMSRSARTEPRS